MSEALTIYRRDDVTPGTAYVMPSNVRDAEGRILYGIYVNTNDPRSDDEIRRDLDVYGGDL